MQFRLRTTIGDSVESYYHSKCTPFHGTGQGSCASPSIWLLISSILMDCLSELAGGMIMTNVNNDLTLLEWINGFVDDTSLFSNIKGDDLNELRNQLRHDMVIWQNLLEASGGKLELSIFLLNTTLDIQRRRGCNSNVDQRSTAKYNLNNYYRQHNQTTSQN